MELSNQLHGPATLALGKNPGTHSVGDFADPRASLEVLEKKNLLLLLGYEPQTVQSIASHDVDCAVPFSIC
jgi:hypothetical protein